MNDLKVKLELTKKQFDQILFALNGRFCSANPNCCSSLEEEKEVFSTVKYLEWQFHKQNPGILL